MDMQAMERSGNLARFLSLELAELRAERQTYNVPVLMGEDGYYLVAATNRIAGQLIRAGYEVAPKSES
jgi:hypothetical protein